jgi:hypothetical protein
MSLLSENIIPGNHGKILEQTLWKIVEIKTSLLTLGNQ